MSKFYSTRRFIFAAIVIIVIAASGLYAYFNVTTPKEKKVLRILSAYTPPELTKQMGVFEQEYEKLHPEIDIVYYVTSWGDQLKTFMAEKAAGKEPDMMLTASTQGWTLMGENLLQPVTDLVDEIGGKKFFYPGMLDAQYINNQYWFIPTHNSAVHVLYRKDLFSKYGLQAPPRSWDDIVKAAKTLTRDTDGDGKIDLWGVSQVMARDYFAGSYFLSWAWSNDASLLDAKGNVAIDTPNFKEALQYWSEVSSYGPPGMAEWASAVADEAYIKGKCAMLVRASLAAESAIYQADPELGKNTGLFIVPTGPHGKSPACRGSVNGWVVIKTTRNYVECKEFIKWFYKPENYIRWVLKDPLWQTPASPVVFNMKEYQSVPAVQDMKPQLEYYLDVVVGAAREELMDSGVVNINSPKIVQSLVLTDMLQDILFRKMSIDAAVAKWKPIMQKTIS